MEAQDAPLVCLDPLDWLIRPQRPDNNLAILRACKDVLIADGHGENRAVMLKRVQQLGADYGLPGCWLAIHVFDDAGTTVCNAVYES